MTRKEILSSRELKKRFCKDNNLPISVYDNPFFYQRVCAIHPFFGCMHKFDEFCEELKGYRNAQEYFEHYNSIKDMMISDIKKMPGFAKFNEHVFVAQSRYPKRDLYIDDNNGCLFLFVDMKKANFSALRHFDPDIFCNALTWEDFMANYTNSKYIASSKYIRQVIFGACNPKRQIQYETSLMNLLLDHIMKFLPELDVYSVASDEIIFKLHSNTVFSMKEFKRVVSECPDDIGSLVRVGTYILTKIKGTGGWMKEYNDEQGTVEFKCLSNDIYHQVVKHYLGDPITRYDLTFEHEGKLAQYMEAIDNPWGS